MIKTSVSRETKKIGAAPGALIFVGTAKVEQPYADVMLYDAEHCETHKNVALEKLPELIEQEGKTCWVNVVGLHEPKFIQQIGDIFGVHILVQEDILNTEHRPKYEEVEQHIFFVLKMLRYQREDQNVEAEQLSMILGDNYLITFQEGTDDVFDTVRQRLINPTTKIRHRKSDYLAFALLDAIIDQYIEIIGVIGEPIDDLEDKLLEEVKNEHLEQINTFRRELNSLRKIIRPLREISSQYYKSTSELIEERTRPFLKDLEDHITQIIDSTESYREMLKDQLDLYQTKLNNRLNDIIRVLTVFSVVFIPLTFLAGIYGTNFNYLPELQYRYSYPIFWGVMIAIALFMITYFKRKRWL